MKTELSSRLSPYCTANISTVSKKDSRDKVVTFIKPVLRWLTSNSLL